MKSVARSLSFIARSSDLLRSLSLVSVLLVSVLAISAQIRCIEARNLEVPMHELIYDMGMNLAHQNLICDKNSVKQALLHVYYEVAEVKDIVSLFMILDEGLVEHDITTIEALIDFELESDASLVQAGIIWLASYQHVFILFQALHKDEACFEIWKNDLEFFASLEDCQQPADPEYLEFWYACCAMLEAQQDFEVALQEIE